MSKCPLCFRELNYDSEYCQPNSPMILVISLEQDELVCHTCYMVYNHGVSCTCPECVKSKIPMMGERE